MPRELSYDEAVVALRRLLVETSGNARAFGVRARARPRMINARSWRELAEIEALAAHTIEQTLSRELRSDPWGLITRQHAWLRSVRGALQGERGLIARLYRETSEHPLEAWRAGAPQLEALWPFLADRTRYLANSLALALDRPAPFPVLVWHPGRRAFVEGRS